MFIRTRERDQVTHLWMKQHLIKVVAPYKGYPFREVDLHLRGVMRSLQVMGLVEDHAVTYVDGSTGVRKPGFAVSYKLPAESNFTVVYVPP